MSRRPHSTARGEKGTDGAGAEGAGEPALGVWLAESDFPADTDTVMALLVQRGTPSRVLRRLAALPWSMTFADLDDCQRRVGHAGAPPQPSTAPPRLPAR